MSDSSANRRSFCRSVVAIALGLVGVKVSFALKQPPKSVGSDQDFVVVNGWVLLRSDLAASDVTPDAV